MAEALQNDEAYYENPERWGEDQFITLRDIIDNIIMTADADSYFKHCERHSASIFGKQGIKRLRVGLNPKKRAIAWQLSPSLTIPFPRYMTNWARISVINDCGKLTTLNINNNPTTHDYLQDSDWELLYDADGYVLRGADFNTETGCTCLEFDCEQIEQACEENKEACFLKSWVKPNNEGSYFEFSPDLFDRIIVIEFTSSGFESMDDCDIKVHVDLELTVENWIRFNLLKGKRNTPKDEWVQYWNAFKLEKRLAKALLSSKISIEGILNAISLKYKSQG